MRRGERVVIVVLAAGAAIWVMPGCDRTPHTSIPRPPLDAVEPEIAAVVHQAEEAVEKEPASAKAWGALGHRLNAHDWGPEALTCYRMAEQLDPREYLWPYLEGRILSKTDVAASAAAFERALAIDPLSASAHVSLARALSRLGREADARQHLETAASLDPDGVDAELGLGQLDLSSGLHRQALDHLLRVLERDPKHREVHTALAQVYAALKEPALARRHAALGARLPEMTGESDPRAARIRLVPAGSTAMKELGTEYFHRGRLPEAEKALREAMRINPGLGSVHYQLGLVLASQGRLGDARAELEEAVRLRPSDADYRHDFGRVLAAAGAVEPAIAQLGEAVALNPDNPEAELDLGILLARRGKPGEAVPHLARAEQMRPEHAETQLELGLALSRLRLCREAMPRLQEALRQSPNHPLALQALRACHSEGHF